MAVATLTNISGLLKTMYLGPVREQLNNSTALFNRLEKNEEDVSGEDLKAYVPLSYGRNQGIGSRAESGTLPTALYRKHQKTSIPLAYTYGRIQLTGQAMKASRNNANAFAKALTNEVNGMVEGMKVEINRQSFGDGSGAMAQITEATGSITAGNYLTVDNANLLEPGMVIDTYAAKTGGSVVLDSVVIADVDIKNSKISLTTTQTVTQNNYIFREDSRGYAMMGLLGIVDGLNSSGTRSFVTTLQGIARSTAGNKFWDGNVVDNAGVNRDLSLSLIQQCYELGEIMSQGKCSAIISGYDVRRAYYDLMAADKRYVNSLKLDGGWSALEYSGGGGATPWLVERFCPKNTVFFLDERTLAYYRASDFDWMDADGSVLARVSNTDAYEGTLYVYMNLGCTSCGKNTVLRDVQ